MRIRSERVRDPLKRKRKDALKMDELQEKKISFCAFEAAMTRMERANRRLVWFAFSGWALALLGWLTELFK